MSTTEHTIRLRGGWEWDEPALGEPRRVVLPCRLPEQGVAGASLVRPFNRPPVDPAVESVWLQLRRVPGLEAVRLNGQEIARPEPGQDEVLVPLTRLAPSRNVLTLQIATIHPEAGESEWGDVALIIKPIPV